MSDRDMASNFNIVDLAARQNSSVDIEGYSLLPDIIWTPGPEMLNSQYGKVIFTNVRECYLTNEDLLCTYSIMSGVEVRDDDRVAIFCVGWAHVEQVITWVPAAKHPWPNEELSVVFPAASLPPPGTSFYQFCYLSVGQVRGASVPFNFVNKPNATAENLQKTLYFTNPPVLGTAAAAAAVNIVSVEGDCHLTVSGGNGQNFTLTSSECRSNVAHPGHSSDGPLGTTTARSDDSYSTEVTISQQYAPNSHNQNQQRTSIIPSAVASTSRGVNSAVLPVPTYPIISSRSRDSDEEVSGEDAQSTEIRNGLQRKLLQLEREKQMLITTVAVITEENARLRASLDDESDKNKALVHNLQRSEEEVDRHIHQHDVDQQNNAAVVTELENELDIKRMRIVELQDIVSEKDRIIAYYRKRFGDVKEDAIALEGPPKSPPNPETSGDSDGQFEQQGHVGIGASSGMQRQDIRTSTHPTFFATLRKTRNYYVTFLSDKADIEQKVFALSCTKLGLVKKLYTMRERKESILRQEYRNYSALERLYGAQYDEIRRLLEAISESTAERKDLDQVAIMEVDMIDEIKNRLEINRQNTCTLKAKAIEVFNKFLESYNYSMEHNSGATQRQIEFGHIQTLYTGLDMKFQNLLQVIHRSANNSFIWN